jgi:SPP1 gp7 family putative phage head morphogenesis protein
MTPGFYKDYLKQQLIDKNGKMKKLKKPKEWLYPETAERKYVKANAEYSKVIQQAIEKTIYPKLPYWLSGGTLHYPEQKKMDSLIDDILRDINATMLVVGGLLLFAERDILNVAMILAVEVLMYNKGQFDSMIKHAFGIETIAIPEPWVETQLELFKNQNAQLLNELKDDELDRVSGIIQRGIQTGASEEQIKDEIEETFETVENHSKLIAIDQIAKLNASVTKLRQQEIGISTYVWRTRLDERVRPRHRVLEGKLCQWQDSTVYLNSKSGKWENRETIKATLVHTGVDPRCRCVPQPDLNSIFTG